MKMPLRIVFSIAFGLRKNKVLGQGGQQIILLEEYDLVVVLLEYPYF